MAQIQEIPERITPRKVIVYKACVDPTVLKLIAEKMKSELFANVKRFGKPRSEDIRLASVDRYYEPYVLVDAKYHIDYLKKRVYTFDVEKETSKVKVMGETLKPEIETTPEGESHKVVKIEAEELFSYNDKAYMVFNKKGQEVPPEEVPSAPSEEHPEKILEKFRKKSGKVEVSPEEPIEIVKERLIKRPTDASTIEKELFQISEHAIIYSPIYEVTLRDEKTGEEKKIRIDGVTAKQIP